MKLLETFQHFSDAYLATLAIACVCAYLGLFTVLRRIVFTGVALAQLAAAGVAAAFFLGDLAFLPAGLTAAIRRHGATLGSLGAAVGGALGLELRRAGGRVSRDALVGGAYAAASALAVLLVWRSARGLAELRNILAGEVLLSREGELSTLWIGLLAVAAVHAVYRRRFLLVSYDPEFARALGLPEQRLRLLLMGTLGVAVALALRAGGLLLVFAFLVLPPVTGLKLGRRLSEATWLAVAAACGASLIGFLAAIVEDLPVAPSIAAVLLALAGLAWLGGLHPRLAAAARLLILALAATAGLGAGAALLPGRAPPPPPPATPTPAPTDHHDHHHTAHPDEVHGAEDLAELIRLLGEDPDETKRVAAAEHLEDLAEPAALLPLVAALGDESHGVRHAAGDAIVCLAAQVGVRDRLGEALRDPDDPILRVHAALAFVRLGELRGVRALIDALAGDEVPLLAKEQVFERLRGLSHGEGFGYDPFGEDAANAAALTRWETWWSEVGRRLHWDVKANVFRSAR